MEKFNFGGLPREIAAVLRDALNWRNARDSAKDALADGFLIDLDESSITFKQWCSDQGSLLQRADDGLMQLRPPPIPKPQTPDTGRDARRARIAKGKLSMVPRED